MLVDADFTLTLKLKDFFINPTSTEMEIEEIVTKEGQKRISYYLSGYLSDPDNKIISKSITINNIKK